MAKFELGDIVLKSRGSSSPYTAMVTYIDDKILRGIVVDPMTGPHESGAVCGDALSYFKLEKPSSWTELEKILRAEPPRED